MAPFREQFFDLLRMEEPSQTKKPGRPVPTSRLFRYSAFDNPDAGAGIPTGTVPLPQENEQGDHDRGYEDEEHMDESDEVPDPDNNGPPDTDPNLGYRERDRFPSDPDESSMEEGLDPSSSEEETEFEPTQHSGGARSKYPARQPATNRKLPIGYYDGRVGPPPSSDQGPRTRLQYADKGLEIPDDVWDPEATSKFYKDASKLGLKARKTIGKLITPVRRPGKKPRKKSGTSRMTRTCFKTYLYS